MKVVIFSIFQFFEQASGNQKSIIKLYLIVHDKRSMVWMKVIRVATHVNDSLVGNRDG